MSCWQSFSSVQSTTRPSASSLIFYTYKECSTRSDARTSLARSRTSRAETNSNSSSFIFKLNSAPTSKPSTIFRSNQTPKNLSFAHPNTIKVIFTRAITIFCNKEAFTSKNLLTIHFRFFSVFLYFPTELLYRTTLLINLRMFEIVSNQLFRWR